uniref:Ig-like domain-containing protein n=1 Tax=Pelusios castaneus TaxID=367368 RepID=A0A8C8S732_9SAUR
MSTLTRRFDTLCLRFKLSLFPLFPAAPRIFIPNQSGTRDTETSFPCHVWGFYPSDITIQWLRDGLVLTESTYSPLQRNLDGTYNLTLTYTFIPIVEDKGSILTCSVSHSSLAQPLQEEFTLDWT